MASGANLRLPTRRRPMWNAVAIAPGWPSSGLARRRRRALGFSSFFAPFPDLRAVLKESFGYGALLIVIAAPVAEEMSKAILPLMVLEKRPWFFGSYSSIVLVGLLSGAVFASVENALYFFVYIPPEKLTQGIILWRLIVCTAMHVGCAALACSGLARAWRRAREKRAEFEMVLAMPRIVAAVAVHGVYNLCALLFAIF